MEIWGLEGETEKEIVIFHWPFFFFFPLLFFFLALVADDRFHFSFFFFLFFGIQFFLPRRQSVRRRSGAQRGAAGLKLVETTRESRSSMMGVKFTHLGTLYWLMEAPLEMA